MYASIYINIYICIHVCMNVTHVHSSTCMTALWAWGALHNKPRWRIFCITVYKFQWLWIRPFVVKYKNSNIHLRYVKMKKIWTANKHTLEHINKQTNKHINIRHHCCVTFSSRVLTSRVQYCINSSEEPECCLSLMSCILDCQQRPIRSWFRSKTG